MKTVLMLSMVLLVVMSCGHDKKEEKVNYVTTEIDLKEFKVPKTEVPYFHFFDSVREPTYLVAVAYSKANNNTCDESWLFDRREAQSVTRVIASKNQDDNWTIKQLAPIRLQTVPNAYICISFVDKNNDLIYDQWEGFDANGQTIDKLKFVK